MKRVVLGLGALVAGLVSMAAIGQPSTLDPAVSGAWSSPINWPADAVHMILLRTGKVLWFRGDESTPTTHVWDPVTGQLESQSLDRIIWCGGHSFLPDGRVLVTGGVTVQGASTGPRHAYLFDPATQSWTRTLDMQKGRYYPTQTVLGDGRTLVFAGNDESGAANDLVEAYEAGGGSGGADDWEALVGATRRMTYYPRMHLMPSGKVLHTGPERTTDQLDTFSQTWESLPSSLYGKRTHGTSVMLPPGQNKVMIAGGHDRGQSDPLATATAEILDLSQPSPAWRFTAPMNHRRMHLNTVILPDGKVLVAGGTSDEDVTPVYPAEIFDPVSETWTVVAGMATKRGYHSSAVLLPDARVAWGGSNGNPTVEIYSPPYLFRGTRPALVSAPAFVSYGVAFSVQSTSSSPISSAVLIRPGASTHSTNMEQRYVPLALTDRGDGLLELTPPSDPAIAPPGYYMLFLVDSAGVPSIAAFMNLGGPAGNRPPQVDAGLNQSVILPAGASLHGSALDDGLPAGSTLSTTWGVLSGPAPVAFANDAALETTATFTEAGTYVLTLAAFDGQFSSTDQVSVVVNAQGSAGYPVESRIAAGSDDAEESATGSISLTSSDLEMVYDGTDQKVGLRFNNLPIPNNETIVKAWIQFTADEKQSEATSLNIRAQMAGMAPPFFKTTSNISSRPLTLAGVSWSPPAWNTVGAATLDERTPDLALPIQEVVSRPDWVSGNSIVIVISGTGHRTARAFESGAAVAPLLHVELANLPINHEPQVDAGADQTIRLPAAAILDGTVTDDGLPIPPGRVTTRWVQESGPGTTTFANPLAIDTTATFSAPGRYELELSADDGELQATNTVAIVVDEEIPNLVKLDLAVTAGADDAEEKSTGSISLTSGDLELVQDSTTQRVGLRFNALAIPRGATIRAAWLQFQADEPQSEATDLLIQGHAADNAGPFTTAKFAVSGRPRTGASASWKPGAWNTVGEAGAPQRTTDVSGIIQEIVNRAGWTSGNSIAFIITGTGHRTAEAYEGGAAKAPRLHVEFN